MLIRLLIINYALFALMACGVARPPEMSEGHLTKESIDEKGEIPEAVGKTTLLPEPESKPRLETYTVVVSDVPVKDLLFSMARDASLNLDINSDIKGKVTLNAIDQTLPQILERLTRQTNIRYELEDGTLNISADTPYLRTYKIDYVNMARETKGIVRVATTLGSTGEGNIGGEAGGSNSSGGGGQQDNSSSTEVINKSSNKFWGTLTNNIEKFLKEEPKIIEEVASGDKKESITTEMDVSNSVIVNQETGLIAVRATQKQHKNISHFIDNVLSNAKRQVLIEATIAEIKLSDRYQSGVDWSLVASDPTSGVSFSTDLREANLGQSPFSSLTLTDIVGGDQLSVTLKSLEQFGDVKVLSSPKVMAINNQPAVLKVVDNFVYFEMDVDTSVGDSVTVTTFETEIKTVPVGFVMSVTPYINEHEVVTLNIRPTISRVIDKIVDPNPEFKKVNVISEVPVIQVREIESVLQINSGDTGIIGGLMQDTKNDVSKGVPILSDIPFIGGLFSYEDDQREKSELIIFIKPIVVKHASLTGDLAEYQKFLPSTEKKKESRKEEDKE
jgi:MSHA type pilus biogenesis protein MshL